MRRHHATFRSRLVGIALSGLLAVSLAGWQAGPAQADPNEPADTVTTLNVNPTTAAAGDTILVSATVNAVPASGDVRGQVRFSVALHAADLWEDDVQFGPESLTQGVGGTEFDLSYEDLPFFDSQTARIYISARYEPVDDFESESYEDLYFSSESADEFVDVTNSPSDPAGTETQVTGPESATVNVAETYIATVTPAAPGSVQFIVDGSPYGAPVTVVAGSASRSVSFSSAGGSEVGAAFTPTDSAAYDPSYYLPGLQVTVTNGGPPPAPVATSTLVTGPTSATVGTPATLAASVSPTSVPGTVQFSVDGEPVGSPVPVTAGAASMSHTFASGGARKVGATFTPSDNFTYAGSADSTGMTVSVGAAATTTVVTGPESATAGTPATLSASVSPVSATGSVQFSVDGSPVGLPVPVAAGTASIPHTFASAGDATIRATFTPANPSTYAGSADSTGLAVSVELASTTTEVTGPDVAKVGEEATLTAAVLPADVPGKVTFYANDTEVATVDVDGGTASTPYTFESEGESSVVAFFEPTDADTYQSSSSTPRTFGVEPGTTSESEPEWWDAPITSDSGSCAKVGRVQGEGTVLRDFPGPIQSFFGGIVFQVQAFIWSGLNFIANSILNIANFVAMTFRVGPFGSCKTVDGRHRAAAETTTVQCVLTDGGGYWCPIDIPAGSRVSMEGSLPIPAGFAGKLVKFETTMSTVDPVTGELTTVGSGTTRVHVPKRTVLSARLAPAKANLTSVQPGKIVSYRVQVSNKGVVTADGVRTCVSLSKGAEVLIAKGAKVHDRRACWTLPSLTKKQTATRTLTLMVPRTTGPLKIVGTVTPKKSQADPLRLTTILPVT